MKNVLYLASFLLSLVLVGFALGIATMHWKFFPYPVLNNAFMAYEAWREVLSEDNLPNGFANFESDAPAVPASRRLQTGAATLNDPVLVTGGPYQLLSECPEFGCLAWVSDRSGTILHTWEVDLDQLWADLSGVSGLAGKLSIIPTGLQLFPDGDLVAVFQGRGTFPFGIGIARFDRDGNILWKRIDYSHHWLDADDQGNLYTPAIRLIDNPMQVGNTALTIDCGQSKIWEDVVRVLSPDGQVLEEISMLQSIDASDLNGMLFAKRNNCDPTHLNSVEVITTNIASQVDGIDAGDLLVSLHAFSAIAILDRQTGKSKRTIAGRTVGQHSPHFLPDGGMLVFDNFGGRGETGGSRIVRLDLTTGTERVIFPQPDTPKELLPFFSDFAGHIDISADGTRALVSVTEQGRIVEIDVETGDALWEYNSTHDLAPYLGTVDHKSDKSVARFLTLGAYYVNSPDFLSAKP